MNNTLIGQSGGPTSVINSTLAGAIQASIDFAYDKIYCLKHGITGLLDNQIFEIDKKKFEEGNISEKLKKRPSSILGSCRHKLSDDFEDDSYDLIFKRLKDLEIKTFVYIGGNDSMDTVNKLNRYMQHKGIKGISIVGAPKTIDNDLFGMDHSPGFGSCAKFINTSLATIRTDCDIYPIKSATIVEIMGRNAGWLTASSLLSNIGGRKIVNLVYTSEMDYSKEELLEEVSKAFNEENNLIIALSEGFMDRDGFFAQERTQSHDSDFNHPIISGIGERVGEYIFQKLGVKTKSVELNILQRTGVVISKTDSEEAFELGYKAIDYSNQGLSGIVPVLNRLSDDEYSVEYSYVNVDEIANKEKKIPQDWFESENKLKENIIKYALPLIQGEIEQDYLNGIPVFVKIHEFTK